MLRFCPWVQLVGVFTSAQRLIANDFPVGGILITQSKRLGHQRWQVCGAIALQTACVGALSTATLDNPVKSIVLTCIVSCCTSLVILNCLVIIGFGILSQDDMYDLQINANNVIANNIM